jgi:hypothetical protein
MKMIFFKNKISGKSKKIIFILLIVFVVGVAAWIYKFQNSMISSDSGRGGAVRSENVNSELASEPDRDADIYGMITSIKGNKITILKFDPSTMPGAKASDSSSEEEASENAISLGQTSSMPGGGGQGGPPSGGGFSREGGFGGSSSTTRQTKLEELKTTSIGTETIEVPVGISIIDKTTATVGQVATEAGSFKDLSSDTMVVIWLEEGDVAKTEDQSGEQEEKRIAEFINVTGKVDMDNSTN